MSSLGDGGSGLESELEEALRRVGRLTGQRPNPVSASFYTLATGGKSMSFLSRLSASLGLKTAVGIGAGALLLGGGTLAAVNTGSVNPINWGQQVVQQVATCKSQYTGHQASDPRANIGQCVASFARQHGVTERELHSASQARQNQPGSDHGRGLGLKVASAAREHQGLHGGPPAGIPGRG